MGISAGDLATQLRAEARLIGAVTHFRARLITVVDQKGLDSRSCTLAVRRLHHRQSQVLQGCCSSLQIELQSVQPTPHGVGLPIPDWLEMLEAELAPLDTFMASQQGTPIGDGDRQMLST